MVLNEQGQNNLEKEIEKKCKKREKKRRPRFKVSGRQVFKLKEIIKKSG